MAVESFPVAPGLESHPKYLRCGLLARHLFRVMIGAADAEGRAQADPLTWQQNAALWGPAHQDPAAIEAALAELYREGLAVTYADGRLLFLPGRFEHNPGREYWSKSRHPLPDMDQLLDHPAYLDGLRRIDNRGKLLRTKYPDAPRYPYLGGPGPDGGQPLRVLDGDQAPDAGTARETPGDSGTVRERPDGVGVGVGVGVVTKRGRARGAPRSPSPEQLRTIEDMAAERGADLEAEALAAGCAWPLTAGHVTAIMRHLKGMPQLTAEQVADKRRRARHEAEWDDLDPASRTADEVGDRINTLASFDERAAWGLLQRLARWIDTEAGEEITGGALSWDQVADLPELWTRAELDPSKGTAARQGRQQGGAA